MANSPDFNSLAVNHTLVCRYWVNWAPVQGWQPCLDGATRRRVSGDCRNLPRGNRVCPLQGHRGWATGLGHSHPLVVRCQSETAGRCRSFIFPKNTPAQTRRPSPPRRAKARGSDGVLGRDNELDWPALSCTPGVN